MRFNFHGYLYFITLGFINIISLFNLGFLWSLLITIVLIFSKFILNMYYMINPQYKKMTLETFPQSHFVEKTRWIMDYINIDYKEEVDAGAIGMFLMGRSLPCLHIPHFWASNKKGLTVYSKINDSHQMLRYFYGIYFNDAKIEQFLRPTQERLDLEQKYFKLGNAIQSVGYHWILKNENNATKFWGLDQPQVPQWQKFFIKVTKPLLMMQMKQSFKSNSKTSYERNFQVIVDIIGETDALLQKNNYEQILGEGFTFVDMNFCSIVALILYPGYSQKDQQEIVELYNKGNAKQSFYHVDKDMEQEIRAKIFQKYPKVAQYVLNTFRKYRNQKI